MSVAEATHRSPTSDVPAASTAPGAGWDRWRRLDGIRFPVAVFAVWRICQAAVVWWHGGRLTELAYTYDGAHYLRILHYGYSHPRPLMPSHAFFPGVPWMATPVRWLTGSDIVAVHLIATLTAVAAFVAVWGVAREWTDERTARRAVVLLAIFPSSLFLWQFYSEAAFIALGAGAVWADRRNRPVVAAACFAGLATTRSVGIVVPLVIVAVRIARERRIDRVAVGYAAAGAAGLGAVLLTMQVQLGDAFAFLGVQEDWGRTVSWPWASVSQGVDNLTPDPRTVMVPALVARNLDLWTVAIVLFAIVYLVMSRRPRFPVESWLLGLAMIALPLCSSVLASFNRFAMADWVIYPAWASMLGRLPTWWRRAALAVLVVASVVTTYQLLGRVVVGRFIG
jgi:4-amino-4-deoxy-L-arabinose transferase-like glycosyltransferase